MRHAEEDLHPAHQKRVEPRPGAAAQRAEQGGNDRRDGRAQKADRQRRTAAVPDHREDVAAHRVRAEEEFPARGHIAVGKIHIGRVAREKQSARQTAEDDDRQHEHCAERQTAIPWLLFGRLRRGRPRTDEGKIIHVLPPLRRADLE